MPSEKKVSDGIGAEARTTRACIPHTPYAWVLDFMQATACYDTDVKKNPRVRTEADNLFGCYGTSVSTYKGVWRSHARGE